jgi:hypothetical protein
VFCILPVHRARREDCNFPTVTSLFPRHPIKQDFTLYTLEITMVVVTRVMWNLFQARVRGPCGHAVGTYVTSSFSISFPRCCCRCADLGSFLGSCSRGRNEDSEAHSTGM